MKGGNEMPRRQRTIQFDHDIVGRVTVVLDGRKYRTTTEKYEMNSHGRLATVDSDEQVIEHVNRFIAFCLQQKWGVN